MGRGQAKYAIVAIDYFTKWVEAEPLSTITEAKTSNFIWRSIVCRFGIPHTIVTDNGRQFDNRNYRDMCSNLGIKAAFSAPFHPQANGQVEAANKIVKNNLKAKLDAHKGAWVDELPKVLWAYRTTPRTGTGETPFSLAFGTEAVVPVEIGEPSSRVRHFSLDQNDELMRLNLDLIEEKRDMAQIRVAAYQQRSARYYNSRVKQRGFRQGDLVLRKIMLNTKEHGSGTLGPTWEGPYRVTEVLQPGTYKLEGLDGKKLSHPWNAEHLKVYYQ